MIEKYKRTDSEVQKCVQKILNDDIAKLDKQKALRFILSAIDLTTLNATDRPKIISNLCEKATSYLNKEKSISNVAAVCVYPPFVKQAKEILKGKGINVASVAGAFPSGQSPLFVKVAEVEYAAKEGADEIDMVISRGTFLDGNYEEIGKEIAAIKIACGEAHLKVILETGELKTAENIWKASNIAINNGADFIKTSTGKTDPAATLEAFFVMLEAIKDYYKRTGKVIGIKPAGGISDVETAINYYLVIKNILGEKWLDKNLFRYGASRLADNVNNAIK